MYDWTGTGKKKRRRGLADRIKPFLAVFTPKTWDTYSWSPTSSPLRFLQCAFVIILCLVFELNAFFLKYVLWIPPPHVLNHIRLALWFGMANVATRRVLRLHYLKTRHGIDKDGCQRMADNRCCSRGDHDHNKTWKGHV